MNHFEPLGGRWAPEQADRHTAHHHIIIYRAAILPNVAPLSWNLSDSTIFLCSLNYFTYFLLNAVECLAGEHWGSSCWVELWHPSSHLQWHISFRLQILHKAVSAPHTLSNDVNLNASLNISRFVGLMAPPQLDRLQLLDTNGSNPSWKAASPLFQMYNFVLIRTHLHHVVQLFKLNPIQQHQVHI